jgi:multidrug efflux pump subunit AcrA (membrane-fusion protein)
MMLTARFCAPGRRALLRAQREKLDEEAAALRSQIEQARESLRHQKAELETHRGLLKDGFISATRISQLEATVADYGVKLEERRSELARSQQRMVDTALRIKALESDYRQQASDQLKVTAARLSEIQQELRKSSDASARQVIVAPAAGEIVNLKFTTAGTVVAPRESIADIVPTDPRLVVEARIRTEDVSRIQHGQRRRSALPRSTSGPRGWSKAKCFTFRPTGWSTVRPTDPITWHSSRPTCHLWLGPARSNCRLACQPRSICRASSARRCATCSSR